MNPRTSGPIFGPDVIDSLLQRARIEKKKEPRHWTTVSLWPSRPVGAAVSKVADAATHGAVVIDLPQDIVERFGEGVGIYHAGQDAPVSDNYYFELITRNDGVLVLYAKYQHILGSKFLGEVSPEMAERLTQRLVALASGQSPTPFQRPAPGAGSPGALGAQPPAPVKQTRIVAEVLQVLRQGRTVDDRFYLPDVRLDPKLYKKVNEVLNDLGGKWKGGKTQAHVFEGAADEAVTTAIATGDFTKPSDFGFFPTPDELADRVIALANLQPGMIVLEPEAGRGALALRAAKIVGPENVWCYELLESNVKALRAAGLPNVIQGDFLSIPPERRFDACVMNPPFSGLADIAHVQHAAQFLKETGKLVAITSPSYTFRSTSASVRYREFLEGVSASVQPIAAGAFKESGTNVATMLASFKAYELPWFREARAIAQTTDRRHLDEVVPTYEAEDESDEELALEAPRG